MTMTCDVAILGGGTGGYVAAIRAAQLGKSVVVIEMDKLGGTCLHRGCIPSKSLLRSAEVLAEINESESYGIETTGTKLVFPKVQQRKEAVVEQLHQGVQYLMRKHKIQVLKGKGRIIGPSIFPRSGAVAVELENGEMETVVSTNLIIATGSRPRILPGLVPDGKVILSSEEALTLEELPASIIIVGGGVIGVEWASMLADFGVQVTVAEAAGQLLPQEDEEVARELLRLLKKRGVGYSPEQRWMPRPAQCRRQGLRLKPARGSRARVYRLISCSYPWTRGEHRESRTGKHRYPLRYRCHCGKCQYADG